MHVNRGTLRAYQDGEISPAVRQEVEAHLASCDACRRVAASLQRRSDRVQSRLSTLSPTSAVRPISAEAAQAQLRRRIQQEQKEQNAMWNKLTSRTFRPVWAVVTILAFLAVAMAFPSVRAMANDLLGLFRVQKIQTVRVDPGNLPQQLGSSAQLETLLSEDVQVEQQGEVQVAGSPEEASALAGIPVRLPAELAHAAALRVEPGGTVTFHVDLNLVKAVLEEIGREDIQLPKELDGARVQMTVSPVVMAGFGDCKLDPQAAREEGYDPDSPDAVLSQNCTLLIQMESPQVEAPAGLDLQQIGEAYLQVIGMSKEDAVQYARNINWMNTLVLPLPEGEADYSDVTVDGVQGTLMERNHGRSLYELVWVKDGILYSLSGPGDRNRALSIANSLP